MGRIVLRNGEHWVVFPTKRGWRATCDKLELSATADTEAQLMLSIDEIMELLCV